MKCQSPDGFAAVRSFSTSLGRDATRLRRAGTSLARGYDPARALLLRFIGDGFYAPRPTIHKRFSLPGCRYETDLRWHNLVAAPEQARCGTTAVMLIAFHGNDNMDQFEAGMRPRRMHYDHMIAGATVGAFHHTTAPISKGAVPWLRCGESEKRVRSHGGPAGSKTC